MFDPMEFEIDEPEKVVYVVGLGPRKPRALWNMRMRSAATSFTLT